MSAVLNETPASNVALVARDNIAKAEAALTEFDKISAGLTELRTKYQGVVFDVKTASGMKAASAARAEIREPRYATEKARKAAKAPLLALGKNIEERASYITDSLLEIETPIDEQIKAEERRKEEEREAKMRAEQERIATIQALIEDIKRPAIEMVGRSSASIDDAMDEVLEIRIDERFGEFKDIAEEAKVQTITKLTELHTAALANEAEQVRIAAERVELERLRAEADRRQKEDAERAAAEIRKRAEEESAARAKIEAEERASRERIETQERAARLKREEDDRQAKAARDAEEARLRAIREEEEKALRAERLAMQGRQEAERVRQQAIREAEEAVEREIQRKAAERMDGRQMLESFVTRFGHVEEFAPVVASINDFLSQQ